MRGAFALKFWVQIYEGFKLGSRLLQIQGYSEDQSRSHEVCMWNDERWRSDRHQLGSFTGHPTDHTWTMSEDVLEQVIFLAGGGGF